VKVVAVAAGLVTAAVLRNASAQPAIENVRIDYRAPESCPDRDWVLRRIRARTERFQLRPDDVAARIFAIAIAESGGRYSGTLEITEPGPRARTTSRRIEAPICNEVAEGLALIAALTIDPRARLEVEEEPEKEQPPPREPVTPPPPPRPLPLPSGPEPEPPALPYLSSGAGLAAASGIAPASLWGMQAFVEVGKASEGNWLSPSLRLSVRHLRHDGIVFNEGIANFRLAAVAADVCPLRAASRTLEIRPCVTGELGSLRAAGTQTPDPQQSDRGWAAVGGLLRVAVWLGSLGLEASAGVEAPLRRDRFVLGETRIGEVKSVVVFGGFAITGRIE
jgi:hypothetical protein